MDSILSGRRVAGIRAAQRGIVLGLALSVWILAGGVRGQTISEFPVTTEGAAPYIITAGPDGNLWFSEDDRNQIGPADSTSRHEAQP